MAATASRGSTAGRVLIVLFICAGIAFLGLLTGGEHRQAKAVAGGDPMNGYYGEDMPRYPQVQELPAGPASRIGGTKVKMSLFSTKDEPLKIARYYADFWRTRHFFVRQDVTHVGGVVSAIDAKHMRIFQIMLTRSGELTRVFPSVTVKPMLALNNDGKDPPLPLFPESRTVITMDNTEGLAAAQIHLSLNEGTMKANIAHYRGALQSAGFSPEIKKQPAEDPRQHVLLYRKGARELTIYLTQMTERKVRVHMMEVSGI